MRLPTLLSALAVANALLLPKPDGPYPVAMQIQPMTDHSRIDPYSPPDNRHHRKLLTSIFWPVDQLNSCTNARVPYMPPATGEWYGNQAAALGLSNKTISELELDVCNTTSLKKCHREKPSRYPLAIFSPGEGNSRLLYTLMARSLASAGYVVVTVDHPYDANIVEFPDGSIIETGNISEDTESLTELVKVRAEDLSFVVSQLQNTSTLTKETRRIVDFTKIVAFGHSLGGASSAMAIMKDSRFRGGVDLDGRLFDPALSQGLNRPFMLAGRPKHRSEDATWVEFWGNLRGSKAELEISGTVHGSYLDYLSIFSVLNLPEEVKSQLGPMVGTIEAGTLDKVLTSIMSTFFTLVLRNESTKFLETIHAIPEVSVTGLVV